MDRDKLKGYMQMITSLLESMRASADRDKDGPWRFVSFRTYIRKYNDLVALIAQEVRIIDAPVDLYKLEAIPSEFDSPGIQQQQLFESVYTNLGILKAFLETKLDLRQDLIKQLRDFVAASLRRAVFEKPNHERDIQNNLEQLLIGRGLTKGIDYDREKGRVKVSIKESIPDFIFPKLDLALEVKLSKDSAKSKAIVDEINADIRAYSTRFSRLLFVVYDLGSIRDEVEFKQGIEEPQIVDLIIIKH